MSSQGIPIHSPKGTLLFIRGVKERIKDPKGEDSVLKEFVRIRNEIRQSHPQLTLFHSSDSFELRHEIGIHSKIFPSWNWKTCHNCLQKLAKGEHRNSQEADSRSIKIDLDNLLHRLPERSDETENAVRCWISNMRVAGQNPNHKLSSMRLYQISSICR